MQKAVSFFKLNSSIILIEEKFNIELRPQASNGLWLMFLLPTALTISAYKHYTELSEVYKFLPYFCVGLISTCLCLISGFKRGEYAKPYELWFFFPISLLFYIFLNSGFICSLCIGFFCTIIFSQILLLLLRIFPKSFTLGEAGMTAQALVIMLFTTLHRLSNISDKPIVNTGQSSTIIIQMELFGIMILGSSLYYFDVKDYVKIYICTFVILLTTFLLPLHVILHRSPVLWVFNLLIEDLETMKLVLYWIICSCIAILFVIKRKDATTKASSAERKIFHILAAAVYIPGFIYECNLLYLGSGILLGIFFLLEILRNFGVPPLGNLLQASFMALRDEKDAGNIALTPLYLLIGFTLPLWIHPSPCDLTDSAMLNILPLLSGILSVGIGDTAASYFGSKYGTHYYTGSKKTIEGTSACILSQFLIVYLLFQFGIIINMDTLLISKFVISVIVTSFVEAMTDQIDNAILPLIMYIILI